MLPKDMLATEEPGLQRALDAIMWKVSMKTILSERAERQEKATLSPLFRGRQLELTPQHCFSTFQGDS